MPIISIDRLYGGKSTFKLGPWVGEYSRWFLWGLRRTRQATRKHGREIMIKVPSTSVELR